MAGLCPPPPTLRLTPHDARRMTRGQCGSLRLHCEGLAPSTPCRSPGASQMFSGMPQIAAGKRAVPARYVRRQIRTIGSAPVTHASRLPEVILSSNRRSDPHFAPAVQPRHHQHVALAELRQHAAQLRLVGTMCAARPFRGTLFAAGGAKLPHLCANALVIR